MTRITRQRMPLTEDDESAGRAALDAAIETRLRWHEGMRRLQGLTDEPERFEAVRSRLAGKGGIVHLYAGQVEAVKAAIHQDALLGMAREIEARLERGISIDGEKADRLFTKLLTEAEVIADATDSEPVRVWMLDRIARWESYVGQDPEAR